MIRWVVPSTPDESWYRPVYSPDGRMLLFERSIEKQTLLYCCPADGSSKPVPFIKDVPPESMLQTRPDWSRAPGNRVAFASADGIWLTSAEGRQTSHIPRTEGMTYPSWYPDGEWMAVKVTRRNGPHTARIDCNDGASAQRLTPPTVYAGMPSISQANSAQLAFAGERAVPPYDEDNNRIYISTAPTNAMPLDCGQGRAPWWSPDGTLVAFESNRGDGLRYAIYLARPDGSEPQRLTDPAVNAQHPKFSPDGKQIVFAGLITFRNSRSTRDFSIGVISLMT